MPIVIKSICVTFSETEQKMMLRFERDFPEYSKFRRVNSTDISFMKTERKFVKEIRKREGKTR